MAGTTKRNAVVSGGNKGIGFAICKQLASEGTTVVLTARDEKRGLEAVDRLRELGLSDRFIFQQLDVTDSASITSLAHFLNTHFGKLDILVNNAAIPGAIVDGDALANAGVETLQPKGRLKDVLSDVESLTEEKIEEILKHFLQEFKEGGSLGTKGWPAFMAAYHVSKPALNGYTRILARSYPRWSINAVCPGYVRTDITKNCGVLSADEGAQSVVRLALLPTASRPSGLLFYTSQEIPFCGNFASTHAEESFLMRV